MSGQLTPAQVREQYRKSRKMTRGQRYARQVRTAKGHARTLELVRLTTGPDAVLVEEAAKIVGITPSSALRKLSKYYREREEAGR